MPIQRELCSTCLHETIACGDGLKSCHFIQLITSNCCNSCCHCITLAKKRIQLLLLLIETRAWGINLKRQIKFHSSIVSSSTSIVFATSGAKVNTKETGTKQEEKKNYFYSTVASCSVASYSAMASDVMLPSAIAMELTSAWHRRGLRRHVAVSHRCETHGRFIMLWPPMSRCELQSIHELPSVHEHPSVRPTFVDIHPTLIDIRLMFVNIYSSNFVLSTDIF